LNKYADTDLNRYVDIDHTNVDIVVQ